MNLAHGSKIERVAELDLLRFLAAFAVVLYHHTTKTAIGPVSQFGYLGVDMFFMISGFVILWSARGATATDFMVSRFARLYPAFWLCMALTIAGLWFFNRAEFPTPAKILANATMVSGYLGHEYIDHVYWTLQVELKFYVLVLGLILFRQMQYVERWLWLWLAACAANAVVGLPGPLEFVIIDPFGPYFIAGAVFYLIRSEGVSPARIAAVIICLALAAVHSLPYSEGFLLGGERSYLSGAIIAGLFALMAAVSTGWLTVRSTAFLIGLSALTYPLYLLHNVIGQLFTWNISDNPVLVIAFVFALAYVVNAIDRPVARWVRRALRGLVAMAPRRQLERAPDPL